MIIPKPAADAAGVFGIYEIIVSHSMSMSRSPMVHTAAIIWRAVREDINMPAAIKSAPRNMNMNIAE